MEEYKMIHLRALFNRLSSSLSPVSDFLEIRENLKDDPMRLLSMKRRGDSACEDIVLEAFNKTVAGCDKLRRRIYNSPHAAPASREIAKEEIDLLTQAVRAKDDWYREITGRLPAPSATYLNVIGLAQAHDERCGPVRGVAQPRRDFGLRFGS